MQAGYASGLLFLCPLGDIFRRRLFVLSLTWLTATLVSKAFDAAILAKELMPSKWLGLCLAQRFETFAVISYLTSVTTVTPQLILPLVGDVAPPEKRAHALSLVVSGNFGGMLIARFLSGLVTQYSSWRIIYWIAFAIQYVLVTLLWFFMPDYPVTNSARDVPYHKILWSMAKMLFKYPELLQACLIAYCISATLTNFWTTLTFLLAGSPYNYNSLVIGCFALIGLCAMAFGPPICKFIMDRYVPLFLTFLGEAMCLFGIIIGTYIGKFTVAGPVIEAFAIDIGLQTSNVANRASIYALEPKARNRLNTIYVVFGFSGQLTGTAVGNKLYAHSGWISSGSVSVGFIVGAVLVCLAKGPYESGWIGWSGGWNCRRQDLVQEKKEELVTERTVQGEKVCDEPDTSPKA